MHSTGAGDTYAYGITWNMQGCQYVRLRVKLAYSVEPYYTFESGWKTGTLNADRVEYMMQGNYFAKSSEHRGYNGFLGSWSSVRRPHPW